ncbi:protein-glutamate methylesterase/protein-glutamine glutaminase [Colwellia hornerae]|uniref:Protein-glutamate methylesterase/protein-glutamine glutaminase n=1 Tax=Colwellia hornerae TaxID=89402 RepID=A0A5C6QGZ1_9GAMM|nr:chemotaxis response regulator protein-glutamate methylesterase [Colwellia hornerae]TWX52832.1 chemotaxis response regulator protein-glutamate methylesterase [Colwellia hornerae]TWX59186.1 chemotaxis response regulator protein-glutamate methylesterase [Colwellia hornerae]TWX68214.1 chemotaxis response regulator protein-glutamate methylesterase [Colwellia hornerae]
MKPIKVLIIDDSSVIRAVVHEVLKYDPEIEVVGEAKDPIVAREQIKKLNPDVLTLDIEMPKMDGITFLKNLMRLHPMPVVMLSTLTTKGADITLQALEIGAIDFIAKPSFEALIANKSSFKETLLRKIKFSATVDNKNYQLNSALTKPSAVSLLPFKGCQRSNHLVAIGASTGGTEAIKAILTTLPSNSPPVIITLHIPKTFSARYAQRMDECCAVHVQEARHGQKIKDGNVYIAPGNLHLKVESKGGALFCLLEDSPDVNRHKPAVDVLFNSLIPVANNVQAILLTGMGKDGAKGLLNLKNAGAMTIIQDKASSLIWGMPGSAHALNAQVKECSLVNISKEVLGHAALDRKAIKEALYEK